MNFEEKARKRFLIFLATYFYSGYFPKMSGTIASFLTLPLIYLVSKYFGIAGVFSLTAFVIMASYFIIKKSLPYFSNSLDPSEIVIDEVAGQLVTFLLPSIIFGRILSENNDLIVTDYLALFLCFRFFDILKPALVGWVDRNIKDALGVLLDDLVAGLFASISYCLIMAIIY